MARKIALIADIHANDVALASVLEVIARDGVDDFVCLGDVAGTGPQPKAVIERVRSLECRMVRGNVDDFLLDPTRDRDSEDDFTATIADIDEWCLGQLDSNDLEFVSSFEPVVDLKLDGGKSLLCYHGSPASNNDVIKETTPDEDLERMFVGRDHALYAGGHTHFQMLRRFRTAMVINPGSVGMAYDRTQGDVLFAPWAEYALLTASGDGLSVDYRRVPYDKSLVAQAVAESGMPHAQWLAAEWSR
jgi:predicted phosphodiesterase